MRSAHLSARSAARIAGLLSLITMAAGIFAEFFVVDAVIASGDAARTASNILAAETHYRVGFAANLVDYTFYVCVTVILYGLLRPVSRSLSLLAMVCSLIATSIVVSVSLCYLAPLVLLGGAPSLSALAPDQAQALASLSLRLRSVGANIGMVFFGLHLVFVGALVARSTFLPRLLGVLSMIGGVCFLINSFAAFLWPPFEAQLLPYILAPGILAQGLLALWLLVMGVNSGSWREQSVNAPPTEFG